MSLMCDLLSAMFLWKAVVGFAGARMDELCQVGDAIMFLQCCGLSKACVNLTWQPCDLLFCIILCKIFTFVFTYQFVYLSKKLALNQLQKYFYNDIFYIMAFCLSHLTQIYFLKENICINKLLLSDTNLLLSVLLVKNTTSSDLNASL